ncbi:MAG TPA: LUD domain-containing protein [Tepidisphaeraceae bacterium]|nr:LUD domain-containing protein [Tepidisphaeraceae bacterium]
MSSQTEVSASRTTSDAAQTQAVMETIRRALGRTAPLATAPEPPAIDESIARLVSSGQPLTELLLQKCEENKMHAETVGSGDLPGRLADYLRSQKVRRVALSGALDDLIGPFSTAGFEARNWKSMTLDELYDFDCGITDVYAAVAETGSLVIRAQSEHGRALSLVPPIHIAIVRPAQIVPDLIDLFEKLGREGTGSAVSLITGPSKTSDIEMNLVVGVHGPTKVQVFLVQ